MQEATLQQEATFQQATLRVFLVQTAQGLTPSCGGYKSNISLLRTLRGYGHAVAQLCYGSEDEIEQSAKRAELKGIEPNVVTYPVLPVEDPRGVMHELFVKTFSDEDDIHNIVISRRQFNAAYPVREF